jgi:hypothetical protein
VKPPVHLKKHGQGYVACGRPIRPATPSGDLLETTCRKCLQTLYAQERALELLEHSLALGLRQEIRVWLRQVSRGNIVGCSPEISIDAGPKSN